MRCLDCLLDGDSLHSRGSHDVKVRSASRSGVVPQLRFICIYLELQSQHRLFYTPATRICDATNSTGYDGCGTTSRPDAERQAELLHPNPKPLQVCLGSDGSATLSFCRSALTSHPSVTHLEDMSLLNPLIIPACVSSAISCFATTNRKPLICAHCLTRPTLTTSRLVSSPWFWRRGR